MELNTISATAEAPTQAFTGDDVRRVITRFAADNIRVNQLARSVAGAEPERMRQRVGRRGPDAARPTGCR